MSAPAKIRFKDLEPKVHDVANMVAVLLDYAERYADGSVPLTEEEADRLIFLAHQADTMAHDLREAYLAAWNNHGPEIAAAARRRAAS